MIMELASKTRIAQQLADEQERLMQKYGQKLSGDMQTPVSQGTQGWLLSIGHRKQAGRPHATSVPT